MSPKVSVIVPIYNVEKYLRRCLGSLINQTIKDIEIILVDDESPDLCPQICDEIASTDSRVKVVHKKNQGLGYARNSGLEIATGEYVYFVDSDDYLAENAVELLYKEAIAKKLDICFGGIVSENEDGVQSNNVSPFAGRSFTQPEITTVVLKGMLGAAPSANKDADVRMSAWQGIYKREFIEKNMLRFPSERMFISEDIIFHLDTLPKAESLGYISECVYYHIVDNGDSLTHRYNPERFKKVCVLYNEEVRRIGFIANNEGMVERAQRLYLGNVRVCLKQIVSQQEKLGVATIKKEIKKIVYDPTLQKVLSAYDYKKNPMAQRVMSFLLKKRLVNLVYYITWLQIRKRQR